MDRASKEIDEKMHPIGTVPYYISAWNRIGELANAIIRQYDSHDRNIKLVNEWATEITWQCALIESMRGD